MSYIVVDIETVAHPCAADFIAPPDLDAIKPAGNLKDAEKIAASIRERRDAATAEYQESLTRAALDWNLSRIVAIGWSTDCLNATARVCGDEPAEASALCAFWQAARGKKIVGFAARTFDAPTLIQRSRLLKVPHPRIRIDRFGRGDVIDIRDILTFDDARYEAIMPRSLKTFCKRFGITVNDPVDGKDVAALIAAGAWDDVLGHVTSDVELTAALGHRVGAFPALQQHHDIDIRNDLEPVL